MYNNEEFDPLQETDVQFGRFKAVNSFEGVICDASLSFFALSSTEIANSFAEGRRELVKTQSPATSKGLFLRSQDETVMRMYARKKSIPWELLESLVIHSKVLQSQDEIIIEEKEVEVHPRKLLRKYFDEHLDIEEKCKPTLKTLGEILNSSFEWLITVMSVMSSGRIDKTGKISMKRFMNVLKLLKVELSGLEVSEIGNILHAFDESDNKLIYYYDFLASIKALFSVVEEELPDEKELSHRIVEGLNNKLEFPSPSIEENKKLEDKKDTPKEESPEGSPKARTIEENEQSVTKDNELNFRIPELDERWCEGEFTITINRCHQCHLHKDYARHYEAVISV